jgi:hypothetical protein
MKKSETKPGRMIGECKASLCSGGVTIAGRTFLPSMDSAYVEFFLGYSFPVVISDKTALHPQVVANSYASLEGKVFNFAHLMRSYNPKQNPRDRILGTIMACELTQGSTHGVTRPADESWTVGAESLGIRCVAVMHKAAEGVGAILESWAEGKTPFGDTPWTVSMENRHHMAECGFLTASAAGLETFAASTPEDLKALGWTYTPLLSAPLELAQCLNNEEDDERDGEKGTRICREYRGAQTVLLIGGLDGTIEFKGVALTPLGKEPTARVGEMFASSEATLISGAFDAIGAFAKKLSEK